MEISRKQGLFNLISTEDKNNRKKETKTSETIPCVFYCFYQQAYKECIFPEDH